MKARYSIGKEEIYAQCKLHRLSGHIDTAWIPEKFAVRGKFLKIKNKDGQWENGWQVHEVYSRKSFSELELKERDHLRQRSASDI